MYFKYIFRIHLSLILAHIDRTDHVRSVFKSDFFVQNTLTFDLVLIVALETIPS